MADAPPPGPPPDPDFAGAPWLTYAIQRQLRWRDGDVVVSARAKNGTTWVMNIIHQLRSGGDREFTNIYSEVPWLEFLEHPEVRPEHLLERFDALPSDRRRVFKTHSGPPQLPYQDPASGVRVDYVVVVRNPEESLVSLWPFLAKHTDEWLALWSAPADGLRSPDYPSFHANFVVPTGFDRGLFEFVATWWALREQANVLLVHFADLQRDLDGQLRRIAEFLGYAPTAEGWATIRECTSFAWMKANADRLERFTSSGLPVLEAGAMVRKGKLGAAREDGMTAAIAAELRELGASILDEEALRWCYSGSLG